MAADPSQFIGAWRLLDWAVTLPDGTISHPYGEHPIGHIIYSENGAMSATFMAEKRRGLGVSRADLPRAVPKSIAALKAGELDPLARAYFFSAITFTGYCGTYSVLPDRVVHHVETCLIPDWVGTDLARSYEFDGDNLILAATENGVTDRLVWQRH